MSPTIRQPADPPRNVIYLKDQNSKKLFMSPTIRQPADPPRNIYLFFNWNAKVIFVSLFSKLFIKKIYFA
jgi:hypothetical protein